MVSEDWISGREHLGNALQSLVEAGHELGIAAEEVALWRTVAGSLNDSIAVLLSGKEGCGKSSLVGALAQGGHGATNNFSHEGSHDLIVWKYGSRTLNISGTGLLENYRPVKSLRHLEFIEIDPEADDCTTNATQRAYMMSDIVLMIFSAADPWGDGQWKCLADMHSLRNQPVAVVLTHAEQRTGEELKAIIDHLCKRSEEITGFVAEGFLLTSTSILAALRGKDEEINFPGVNSMVELRQWFSETVSQQPDAIALRNRVHSVMQDAAQSVHERLDQVESDSSIETDCMRSVEDELKRGMEQTTVILEEERSEIMNTYKCEMLKVREKLANNFGIKGFAGSFFQGGGWIAAELERVAGILATEVEAGLRRSISRAEDCLVTSSHRIRKQIASVFEGEVTESWPKREEPRQGVKRLGRLDRQIHLRVHEALEDREEVGAIGSMIGWRRIVLWVMLLGLVAGAERAWSLNIWSSYAEEIRLIIVPGALLVILLWFLVYLRIKKRRILLLYDRVLSIAQSQIERRIEEIQGLQMELCRQDLPDTLGELRARAGQSADHLRRCRKNAAHAITLARQL